MRRWLAWLMLGLSCLAAPVAADPIPDDIGTRVAVSYVEPALSAFEDAADEIGRAHV